MKKTILCLALIYSIVMVTACPSKSGLERAFNESARIGELATVAAVTTGDFYRSGFLTLEVKDKIAAQLAKVVKSGQSFHQVLVAMKQKYGNNLNSVPKSELVDLDLLFSTEVIKPFLDILTTVGLLPPEMAKKVLLAFSLLRTAILAVSGIFGRGSVSYNFYRQHQEVNYAAG
jgi:hypothetical protein